MRWWIALLLGTAALDAAPIVVLRGDSLATARPQVRAEVDTYAQRTLTALRGAGVPCEVVSDAGLTLDRLAGAKLAVLPYNQLDDAQVAVLRAFVAGGGRLAACFTTGSEQLPALLGVRRGELLQPRYDGQLARIHFTAAARQRYPGLPASLEQGSWNTFELQPQAGTQVLGEWSQWPLATLPAVTENAAGVFVGHVLTPGDLAAKAQFLIALAARDDASLWQPILTTSRARALALAERVSQRWTRLAARTDLPPDRRAKLQEQAVAVGVKAGALPLPGDPAAAPALLAVYRAVADEARATLYRLAASPSHELRGLWVFGSQPIDWPKLASQARNAGLNAIFYRVSRGASAIYNSAFLPQENWSKGRDEIATALDACHRYGLELHAWRVCYHLGSAPSDYRSKLRAEGRISVDPQGREAPFANPADPRNQAAELAAVRELTDRWDVDGIHLDYIRYTDEPSLDFDYSAVSRREFEAVLGRPVESWPHDVYRGALKQRYEDWLRSTIDDLVRRLGQQIKAADPRVCYSAAVWRNHHVYRHAIKQDWPRWLREGWLDLLVPMDYVTNVDDLRDQGVQQVALAGGSTRVALGLGAWLLDEPADLLAQVEVARACGADGFVLFSSNAANLSGLLDALHEGATAEPARPATQTPPATWRLPEAVTRPNAPAAVAAGAPTTVQVVLGHRLGTWAGTVKGVAARLLVVNPETGQQLAEAGKLVGLGGLRAELTARFDAPAGRFQLVIDGRAEVADGPARTFQVRGPLLDGWTAADQLAYASRFRPPRPTGSGLVIGIVQNGIGDQPLATALAPRTGVQVVPLYRLTAAHLQPCRIVILPQLRDVDPLTGGALDDLRDWVAAGGTLLATHDAVGWRWHPTPFWELGWGAAVERQRTVTAGPAFPGQATGWSLEHAYSDRVLLQVTPAARVLVTTPAGQPVVAEGAVGRGRVILCGLMLGYTGGAAEPPQAEVELLARLLNLP